MKLSAIGTRLAAWGLLAATFAMGAALLLTSWSSYRSVMAASAAVTRSQGDAFLRALLTRGRHDVSAADLQSFLEEQRPAGLQYVAVFDHDRLVGAGQPLGGPPDASSAPSSGEPQVRRLDTRFRLVLRPQPPGPPRPGRPLPPAITIEYEPLLARLLESGAVRALRWSAAAATVLLVIAALFARMLLQREAAERRYEERRRLAALGEMSSVLAHELRNPLASLKGHAQLLVERLPAGRDRAKAETIVLEARRLEALSASLLDFSRSGPVARGEVDPAALLVSAAAAVAAARIRVSAAGSPPRWPLDEPRMRQLLTNLLSNAVEASPADASVEAGVAASGDRLLFTVRDHGEGLPAGQEHRLFEPFFTTRAKGTGLGLAIAQRIVEMHGGTISAANHPQGGAVFRVELPRG